MKISHKEIEFIATSDANVNSESELKRITFWSPIWFRWIQAAQSRIGFVEKESLLENDKKA